MKNDPFNATLEDVWQFAPRILVDDPFHVVVCLIWTSPFTKSKPNDWSITVILLGRFFKLVTVGLRGGREKKMNLGIGYWVVEYPMALVHFLSQEFCPAS